MTITHYQTEILIVDDSLQYAKVLDRILRQGLGYSNITTARSVEEAETIISSDAHHFDLVFVDHNLGQGATGCDLLREISESKVMRNAVFFLITSEPSSENMKKALDAGAAGLIAKPFDRELLRQHLMQAAKYQEMAEEESF